MTGREKSDGRVVPQDLRKKISTQATGGGKATTVNKDSDQLCLFEEVAVGPNSSNTPSCIGSTISMEEIVDVENMQTAFRRVAENRGAPGPDGRSVADVKAHFEQECSRLQKSLLDGSYRVQPIRRVFIPKRNGKQRALGIPNVIDRWVAQAVLQVLGPRMDPNFHSSSHGFRPGRSCHSALQEARRHVGKGKCFVVDIDLEDFFNRVHHQRLMSRLERYVSDPRVIQLLWQMLRSEVVMPDGIKVTSEMGTPQGGPLSPLLSNLVLDELDQELTRRKLSFVRYADDVRIFVSTRVSGERVLGSLTRFIESRMRLSVNREKSYVSRVDRAPFLGFRIQFNKRGGVGLDISKESLDRLKVRIRELTPRNWGRSLQACILQLNRYLRGWLQYYGLSDGLWWLTLKYIDGHTRRRLRALILKHWKRKRSIARRLIQFGVPRTRAWSIYRRSQSWWRLSQHTAVQQALSNEYFENLGLYLLSREHRRVRHQIRVRLEATSR